MTRVELDDILADLIESNEIPTLNAHVMSEILLDELESNWSNLPEQTQSVVLAIAGGLKKQHVDELHSDSEARALVKN